MYQYVHGGDIYSAKKLINSGEILDFSANINPLGLPPAVKDAVIHQLDECTGYPDPFCRELVTVLAEYENTQEEHILCGNGASDIIFRLVLALRPKKALLLAPTFADYEKALNTVHCEINYYNLKAQNDFSVQHDFLDQITAELDMVFICNPNNPTGQLCTNPFLKKVFDKCLETDTIVLVDECFMDFVDDPENYSAQSYLCKYSNLLILKAFTKIFAMPGIRLGYVLTSNPTILDQTRLAGQDWSVSLVAQAAGKAALTQIEYLEKTKLLIRAERKFLIKELSQLGFKVFGSKANYVFFESAKYLDLHQRLLGKGILIRSCSNYVNLKSGYFRIAVKNHEDNCKLIATIKDVII
ncbi:MAG: threonine-phosphate decarboxylase [Peptococcaceae bacterium]|nr:threonine-phosphate decarboxylase [Peptococcaceae bacterium]